MKLITVKIQSDNGFESRTFIDLWEAKELFHTIIRRDRKDPYKELYLELLINDQSLMRYVQILSKESED